MTKARSKPLAIFAALLLSPFAAQAGIIITTDQIGDDFVFSYSGSLDTTGLTPTFITNGLGLYEGNATFNNPPDSAIAFGVGPGMQGYDQTSFTVSSTIQQTIIGTATGDGFALFASDTLALPIGYISGTFISGTLTLESQSFASLGMIAGIYETFLPSQDFIRMELGVTRVPEPGILSLLAAGLLGMGLRRRRRQT